LRCHTAGGEMGRSEVVKMKLSTKQRMMSIMSEAPPGPFGCHERRSGARIKIKHEIATPSHILDRIGNQPRRLLRQSAHRRISL